MLSPYRNFSREFDRRMMIVRMFNKLFYSVSVYSSEQEYNMSSIKRFQTSGFSSLWLRISVSTLFMNIIRKGDCHFRAHGCTMCLKVVFSLKLE